MFWTRLGWLGAGTGVVASLLAVAILLPGPAPRPIHDAPARKLSAQTVARALPLAFEANLGQAGPEAEYVGRAGNVTLLLRRAEAALVLRGAGRSKAVSVRLSGAAPEPQGELLEPTSGHSSYWIGNDPQRWRTGVAHYGKVRYREVYPGVDLVYYGSGGQLEYDFVVSPQADATRIRLRVDGAAGVRIDASGDLLIDVGDGELRQQRPKVYQRAPEGLRLVDARYQLASDGSVLVALGHYDRSRELVIDPVLSYASYIGGFENDRVFGLAVDGAGAAYLCGDTSSSTFPDGWSFSGGSNPSSTQKSAGFDAFVTKVVPNGNRAEFSVFIGGNDTDSCNAIAIDGSGNAYITGDTNSTNFPLANALLSTRSGETDAFYSKLNAAGTQLLYSTLLGGDGQERGYRIAVDPGGSAYLTGLTTSSNFPVSAAAQATRRGAQDAFLTRYNAAGSAYVFSTYHGGDGPDEGRGIDIDAQGSAYVGGNTASANFPVTQGALQTQLSGARDGFVSKFGATGALQYATYLGGGALDDLFDLAVDGAGSAYATGRTSSTDFPAAAGTTPFQSSNRRGPAEIAGTFIGPWDIFVAKLNTAGTGLSYRTYIGGTGADVGRSIAVDGAGLAYITGLTNSADFPLANATQPEIQGRTDAITVKLDGTASRLVFSTYFGGGNSTADDIGEAIAVGPGNSIFFGGRITFGAESSLNRLLGQSQTINYGWRAGTNDGFIVKLADPPPFRRLFPTARSSPPPPPCNRIRTIPTSATTWCRASIRPPGCRSTSTPHPWALR